MQLISYHDTCMQLVICKCSPDTTTERVLLAALCSSLLQQDALRTRCHVLPLPCSDSSSVWPFLFFFTDRLGCYRDCQEPCANFTKRHFHCNLCPYKTKRVCIFITMLLLQRLHAFKIEVRTNKASVKGKVKHRSRILIIGSLQLSMQVWKMHHASVGFLMQILSYLVCELHLHRYL